MIAALGGVVGLVVVAALTASLLAALYALYRVFGFAIQLVLDFFASLGDSFGGGK